MALSKYAQELLNADRRERAARRAKRISCPKGCGAEVWYGLEADMVTTDVLVNVHWISSETAQFLVDNDRPIYYLDTAINLWGRESVPADPFHQRRLLAPHVCQGGTK